MKLIKIKPKTLRAKNRVNEHGEVMVAVLTASFNGHRAFLVESQDNTWRGEKWLGWLTVEEAEFEEL